MISKKNLTSFIDKYYLGGLIESTVIESENGSLMTKLITPSKDMIGIINCNDVEIEDAKIGVYYTGQLLKMLSILDDDIKVDLVSDKKDNIVTLKVNDDKGKYINYATTDVNSIESFEQKSKATDYEIKINITSELTSDILKSSGAIESKGICFQTKKDKLFFIFGDLDGNKNQIKFEVATELLNNINDMTFNVLVLRSILVNNKTFDTGTIEVSSKGIMRVHFEYAETTAEYFLIKQY